MAPDYEPDPPSKEEFRREFGDLPGQVPIRDDAEIVNDVESELFYDSLVRSFEIKIDCLHGVVTLSGTVGSDAEGLRAVEDARKVPGVKQVINQIQISHEAIG